MVSGLQWEVTTEIPWGAIWVLFVNEVEGGSKTPEKGNCMAELLKLQRVCICERYT